MAESLNVIALISGGKDSFFSLLHCIENGHEVVALANLFPPNTQLAGNAADESDVTAGSVNDELDHDLDSYMYQTVGHSLVPLFAGALGLPLYRQPITGSAVNSFRSYHPSKADIANASSPLGDNDETECLIPLLQKVLEIHPEANAVCSGAILSTYQRTRIESVALRLGLVPLSYLWQYPVLPPPLQGNLLDDMAAAGFDVRIVKVASGGLEEDLLWCNLLSPETRRKVQKATERFGGSVLGEGGEYETLVVEGPSPTWKRRINADELKILGRTQRDSGGTASLVFPPESSGYSAKIQETTTGRNLRKIPLWDKKFDELRSQPHILRPTTVTDDRAFAQNAQGPWVVHFHHDIVCSRHFLLNMTGASPCADAEEQMTSIVEGIRKKLYDIEVSTSDILFTTIILDSVENDFAPTNEVYKTLFAQPNPPARVTIAAPLPQGVKVMVSLIVNRSRADSREGLHVQSRSYWAPANIGPYSQAISLSCGPVASLVYVAGQIPLIPASMLPLQLNSGKQSGEGLENEDSFFQHRACLGLQHLWRIGEEQGVGWWTGAVAFITGAANLGLKAMTAYEVWKQAHKASLSSSGDEMDEGPDVWDKAYGGLGSLAQASPDCPSIPDFSKLLACNASSPIPGLFVAHVNGLPRGCDIEWESLGLAKSEVQYVNFELTDAAALICTVPSIMLKVAYISVLDISPCKSKGDLKDRIERAKNELLAAQDHASSSSLKIYSPFSASVADLEAQIIPCIAVWGNSEKGFVEVAAGLVLQFG